MNMRPVGFGQAQPVTSQPAMFQGSQPSAVPFSGGDSVHFGHGNSKQHPSIVKGSVEKRAKRLEAAGQLPEGMSRAEYVDSVMQQRAKRRYHS